MISRVIFIGDPYRGEQAVNIEKIRTLFSPVLRQLGIVVQVHITDINRTSDRDLWVPFWQSSLNFYPGSVTELIDVDDAAIIGFEVPEAELSYLNEKNIPWINFCIHPLRFLDDLYFDVTTSFAFDMQDVAAPIGLIDLCANRFLKYNTQGKPLAPKTLLICGQDWIDRSIYFDNKFRDLEYYTPQLNNIVSQFERVLYKPHPSWAPKKIEEIMAVNYQAVNCADTNVYDLFANERIDTLCAISSSVLTEAPHFGVQAVYLEPRAKRYGPAISYRALLDSADFWETGLLGRKSSRASLKISQAVPPNHLRRTFSSWGFVTDESRLEGRISSLELRVSAAEALSQGYEERVAADNARTLVDEQRAAAAEALAKEQAQRAAAAEALAKEQAQRAAAAEALAKEQQKRVDELGGRSHHWWQQACALEAERNALLQSWSWRITAPLRFVGGLVLHPATTVRNTGNQLLHSTIVISQRPLSRLMAAVLRRPQLSYRINQWLLRYPALYQQLLGVARQGGVVPGGPVSVQHPIRANHETVPKLASLTPHARQIYADLKTAIQQNKKAD